MRIVAMSLAMLATACLPVIVSAQEQAETKFDPEHIDFFESKVRPIFIKRCVSCHGEEKQESGLRMDARSAILHGADSGKVVVPGKPEESGLIRAIRYEDYEMPPSGQMPEEEIAAIEHWVKLGMPWPEEAEPAVPLTFDERLVHDKANHWAFQPIANPEPPQVESDWPRNEIDRFVLNRLQENEMTPASLAARRTLIRRATLDLHGVPPTAEEVQAFVSDESPDAYAKLIDRLLASPKYGEKWGRHWLDVARYSDTRGYLNNGQDRRFPFGFAYRDYVIDAFNHDVPYDQFIKEQLAADYFVEEGDPRLAALGFIRVGRQFLRYEETIDDRIDAVTRGVLGLTVSCARCHDHKYDAISAADYYGLYGVFDNLQETTPLIGPEDADPHYDEWKKGFDALQQELADHDAKAVEAIRVQASTSFFELLVRATSKKQDVEISKYEQNELEQKEVRPVLVSLWKQFADRTWKPEHAVWGPLAETRALGEEAYAEQHEALIAKWTGEESKVDATVREALAEAKPATLPHLVDVYAKLLKPLGAAWREVEFDQDKAAEKLEGPQQELAKALFVKNSPLDLERHLARAAFTSERNARKKIEGKIRAHELDAAGSPPRAMAVTDKEKIAEPVIFIRGDRGRRGEKVPRQFVRVLNEGSEPTYTKGSGRLELAEDIIAKDNPLTARVIANRVWMGHFDRPLVLTPGDFGVRSDPPTHPQLLDHLASYLMNEGWSLKKLHKHIMLSATYQQSSDDRPEFRKVDPENRLLWKMNRRRLTFEETRDSMLAVSGALDLTMGGRAIKILEEPYPPRRTVYGFVDRQDLPNLYRAFDYPSPDATTPERSKTSVPQQALYLLNSPFVQRQAARVVDQAIGTEELDDQQKLERVFQKVLQRSPQEREAEVFLKYVAETPTIQPEAEPPGKKKDKEPEQPPPWTPWHSVAQVVLVSNEFMFVD